MSDNEIIDVETRMKKKDLINYKIRVLRELYILDKRMTRREAQVRIILGKCDSWFEMDRKLRDLVRGKIEIDEFIHNEIAEVAQTA